MCGQLVCECATTKSSKAICNECEHKPCICEKLAPELCGNCGEEPCSCKKRQKIKIKLKDGKEREIQHMISTSFWSADGKPISAEEFLNNLFGELPALFSSEAELRTIWSHPMTRKTLLEKLSDAGYGKTELTALQQLIDAEKSDLFDVLEYVFNSDIKPMTREDRVVAAKDNIFALLNAQQREFIDFVLSKYIESGVDELDQDKLAVLLNIKYHSLEDAKQTLGSVANISSMFIEFQKHLYEKKAA
jgi:type I restriction enzyme R subunit